MSLFHRRIKNGIAGTAYVTAAGGVPPEMRVAINIGSHFRCPMDLTIQIPGREPYAASTTVNVDPNRPVEPGVTLPVVVDPKDPQHLEIDLSAVLSIKERNAQVQQETLDAFRAAQPPPEQPPAERPPADQPPPEAGAT